MSPHPWVYFWMSQKKCTPAFLIVPNIFNIPKNSSKAKRKYVFL